MKNLAQVFGLSLVLLMPAYALAEDDAFSLGGEEEQQAQPKVTLYNYARLNLGYVSNDNFQFSQYRDLADKGGFVSGDLAWSKINADKTGSWTVDVTNLGLDNQGLKFAWADSENLRVKAGYSESPITRNNTGITPFLGEDTLVLPSTWTAGVNTSAFDLSQFTRRIDNRVLRKTFDVSVDKLFGSGWRLAADASFEKKEGTMLKGMAIYFNAANPQAVILPAPVDQKSDQFGLKAAYNGNRLVVEANVTYRRFRDNVNLVTWQNPYASGLGVNVDYPNGIGGYAGAPDYNMLAYSIASGYTLSERIRFTLDGMTSTTRQQESLVGYTVNPLLTVTTALPTDTMHGPLNVDMFNAAMLTRPMDRLKVNLRYRFNERKNHGLRYAWQYVRGDGADQPGADFALFNRPLDYEKELYTVDGKYTLANRTRIGLSYDYSKVFRNYASVYRTEEDAYTFTVEPARSQQFQHRMEITFSDLSGSTYEWSRSYFQELAVSLIDQVPDDQRWTEHPLLRQYQLANQQKVGYKWSTSWTPSDVWMFQGQVAGQDVDFDKSELGLTKVHTFGLNLSAHYTGNETYNSWAWLGFNDDRRQQMGRDFLGGINKPANRVDPPLPEGSDPSRNYRVRQDGQSWSAGLGMQWHISDKWSVKTSYALLWAITEYHVTTYGALDLAGTDFPKTRDKMHNLKTEVDYTVSDNVSLALEHQYFRYSDNSWQYDGVAIGDVAKVLTTGLGNPNEAINMITLSASYKF